MSVIMSSKKYFVIGLVILTTAIVTGFLGGTRAKAQIDFDWRSNWALQSGFNAVQDARGFQFPTSIAFVPNPGNMPKDPLYFVAEIRGTVKVVTNDRSVFTFAEDFFKLTPRHELPSGSGEVGLAGLCLAPSEGFVFVTFAYQDADNILRNNIVRFESTPNTFSLVPSGQIDFTEVFAPFRSVVSHQIGPCEVLDDLLYVNVGDGYQPLESQNIDSLLGKVLRMTLDGKQVETNPFFKNSETNHGSNYVWASGLRNPFGLKIVDGSVFVSDNGPTIDRFLRIDEGSNYLWSGGNNFGVGSNSDLVISPGKGVAQLDYYPENSHLFPDRFRDSFYLTVTGSSDQRIPNVPNILQVAYNLELGKITTLPSTVMQHQGDSLQVVAALAFGPDGLYFAPLFPDQEGNTSVIKINYDPEAGYPYQIQSDLNPLNLMDSKGCFACHTLNNNAGGKLGPNLDRNQLVPRIQKRLGSAEYIKRTQLLDASGDEPYVSFKDARQSILSAEGVEKVRLWIENQIQEPRFDDPDAVMPNLGIGQDEAASIADYLVGVNQGGTDKGLFGSIRSFLGDHLPDPTLQKHLLYFFAFGMMGGGITIGMVFLGYIKIKSRQS